MKIVGIIVEYNPLHNGHKYHLETVKKQSNADLVIACMSSSIVNRGELAVYDKFDRTSLALKLGVDLVIELPCVFSIQNADIFAEKSVLFLNQAGVNEIWIGSETGDIDKYEEYIECMNSPHYNTLVKDYLSKGLSYKLSTSKALEDFYLEPLLSNDILGISYYKAIKKHNLNIKLQAIKRIENNYLDTSSDKTICSAMSIRKNTNNIINQIPDYSFQLYKEKGFIDTSKLFLYFKVIIINNDKLENIFLCDEGIHNALKSIYKYKSYDEFVSFLTTKRYTSTKIRRLLLMILFNLTKDKMFSINNLKIDFIRVLGYNEQGKSYLKNIKKNTLIYTNIKNGLNEILDIEIQVSKTLDTIYNLNLLKKEQNGPIK